MVLKDKLITGQQIGAHENQNIDWRKHLKRFPNIHVIIVGRKPTDTYVTAYNMDRLAIWKPKYLPLSPDGLFNEIYPDFMRIKALYNKVKCIKVKYDDIVDSIPIILKFISQWSSFLFSEFEFLTFRNYFYLSEISNKLRFCCFFSTPFRLRARRRGPTGSPTAPCDHAARGWARVRSPGRQARVRGFGSYLQTLLINNQSPYGRLSKQGRETTHGGVAGDAQGRADDAAYSGEDSQTCSLEAGPGRD